MFTRYEKTACFSAYKQVCRVFTIYVKCECRRGRYVQVLEEAYLLLMYLNFELMFL
jgi:hypothetical protein